MTLLQALSAAKSEEDVKDAYVKAIGLKKYSKGWVDIQTDNMWFEAKEAPTAAITMFAQLLFYVRRARLSGLEHLPPVLGVIDREKAALLETELALPVIKDDGIDWPKAASDVSKKCIAQVAAHIDGQFSTFAIASQETEFLSQIKSALTDGKIIRTPITPDNLRQVFNKWVEMVGREMVVPHEGDYASLFFADIMHDGDEEAMTGLSARLLKNAKKPVFLMKDGRTFEPASLRGYNNFWRIYHRPPETRHRHYLLERRDILLPFDEQKFKGAYYTPPHIVDKAYDLLTKTLGEGWQEDYIIWDMCCGVGNLELSHSNPRNLFMSTLDQEDIDGMKSRGTFAGVEMFQYDYLNDDVTDFGEIDYTLSNKLPPALRRALADAKAGKEGAKKILVLINPPYAETGSGIGKGDTNKRGVERTRVNNLMRGMELGYASKELFVQFLVRIQQEIPQSIVAMFSTMKYVNAPNFENFRRYWTAKYLDGFVLHSRAFDSLKGDFPISFLLWNLKQTGVVSGMTVDALDKNGNLTGRKSFTVKPASQLLNAWMSRAVANGGPALPLSNAMTVSKNPRQKKQCAGSVGFLYSSNNDLQHAGQETLISSSIFTGGNGGGYFITPENLWQAAIIFTVRMVVPHTWQNHSDQFLQPSQLLTEEFKSDCLIWMLFAGKNLTAGADGLVWNDRTWSLTNHFIPFSETEVSAQGRFESDFMSKYIKGMAFTPEAQAVLDEGRALWTRFHTSTFSRKIRDEFRLGRPDAGWYQIRNALDANNENDPVNFSAFKSVYAALGDKLRPLVFKLGFLPT
jgi:hypothetical protein